MATPRPRHPALLLIWLTLAFASCQSRRSGDKNAIADLRRLTMNTTRPGAAREGSAIELLRKKTLEAPPVPTPGQGSATCDFETPCPWVATPDQHSFQVVSGRNVASWKDSSGPLEDSVGDSAGHFLYLRDQKDSKEAGYHVYVKMFGHMEAKNCYLKFMFHAHNIKDDMLVIYSETNNSRPVHIADIKHVANNSWVPLQQYIGSPKQNFQLVLEVLKGTSFPFHAAFDNITLENCFPDFSGKTICNEKSFECQPGSCVETDRVCDITTDCPNGDDEKHQCDQLLNFNAYCDFEHGMCGWTNNRDDDFEWHLESNTSLQDHTFKNKSGHYMYLSHARKTTLGSKGILTSMVYPPPPRSHRDIHSPHFNSCQIRFYYRMTGSSRHQLEVNLVELTPFNSSHVQLWRAFKTENDWQRVITALPHLRHRYQIQFSGSEGLSRMEHIAIDDVTLSPECFGIGLTNVSASSWFKFSTCGATGRRGPTSAQCKAEYGNVTEVSIADSGPLAGVQQWVVPETGIYSVFIRGASGGLGANNKRPSKATSASGVFNWTKGEVLYILVGQEGIGASQKPNSDTCIQNKNSRGINALTAFMKNNCTPVVGGGGGGGGATFVFKKNERNESVPVLVAAGGGGLGSKMRPGSRNPDGRATNRTLARATSGKSSSKGAGGGGGWKGSRNGTNAGRSLLQGAEGGAPCNGSDPWKTEGGFGGGGGPCLSGGGGGGYAGGDATTNDSAADNGHGGYSYVSGLYASSEGNSSQGPGSAIVIPAFAGCGCEYLCVMLNLENSSHMCICQEGYALDADNSTCISINTLLPWEDVVFLEHLIIIIPIITIIIICIATVMFFLYQRYRRQTAQPIGPHVVASHPELQLNRLRPATGGGMVTEYNPNYEFGGSTCTIQDLREVQRENLSLVKALGQGAFGEVYQGYLSNVPGELRDVPVAIKTLPEVSSNQAEMDFLMEALIMSKFTHPNIVRFIGVCFEMLPKFIILELLPGGDLKSFLRESRPKPDKPSPLTMRDLVMLAIDVAKGCHYLEENHFIHRDIAARNCLLTTKDVTRVVKIADFGMARDIYRADYYRKGGKAMLPVKWMPPEAFLDGIFTSKTDVWSFGVLLWEVMSLGYMPYPGRGNQDVMQLVTSGGRLEPPNNCPQPVYHIMSQCWHPKPEERPNFITILERLGYCFQDPDVTNAPLPVFHCPPTSEHDATIMRANDPDSVCLQVQRGDGEPQSPASTDYLIPIPSSSYSLCTEKTELQSASSLESVDRLLELDDKSDVPLNPVTSPLIPQPAPAARGPSSWETSFMKGLPKAPAAWSGDYQSIPTHEEAGAARAPLVTIPPPESSPARKSPPSAIARQRPSVKKPPGGGGAFLPPPELDGQAPLPLDPATLSKQHQAQVLPYANVAVANDPRTTPFAAAPRNEPYTITAPRGAAPPSNKGKYDKDAQC